MLLRAQGMRVLFDSSSQGGSGRPRARRHFCAWILRGPAVHAADAIYARKKLLFRRAPSIRLNCFCYLALETGGAPRLGIPVVSENPGVGRNFMDGAYAVVKFRAKSNTVDFRHCDRFGPHSASLPWNSDELFRRDPICRRVETLR